MYRVIKINRAVATRTIELLNEITGTQDLCFDDSALVSYSNFDFVAVGKAYDCKIELFGDFTEKKTDSSVEVRVINPKIMIGIKSMLEVQVGKDIYYIPQSDAEKINMNSRLYYEFTRKDLIQVDDVIHDDCL